MEGMWRIKDGKKVRVDRDEKEPYKRPEGWEQKSMSSHFDKDLDIEGNPLKEQEEKESKAYEKRKGMFKSIRDYLNK